MSQLPPRQRRVAGLGLQPSSFVRQAVERLGPIGPLAVLDLPTGTGRHTFWLADRGHRVTVADIDPQLVAETVAALHHAGHASEGCVVDATQPLPFADGSFDLVVITDFVDEHLLGCVARLLRPGGYLMHESYAARGGNWRQLLPPGRTVALLGPALELLHLRTTPAGPTRTETEAVKLTALRTLRGKT